MSRRRDFEIMFGSDSFLDVVANIVGILIILIVIAGVRVSQAPPKPKTPSDVSIPDLESKPAPSIPFVPDIPVEATAEVPEPIMAEVTPEPESDAPIEPLPPLVPPPELVAQVGDLEKEIAAITEESRRIGDSLAKRNQQQTDLDLRLQTARSLLEERQGQLQASAAKAAQGKMDLELTRQALARLLVQVKELESKSPPVEKLQHRITPVSRTVMGRELHFRLEKNRVAEVPIEALVERLKEHIERRKDWILKTRQHKGQVGPIGGFNLEYIIGVDSLTGLEETRGIGGYRMSMRYWEIHPEENLRGETGDVALSQGSKFYQALVSAGSDTTLTFWVYPDSYDLYRKLQVFAHEQGFPVAGRPLPAGVAISGSPNGTKSASQ